MKLGKRITIIFDTIDEFNECKNVLNINNDGFEPSLEQVKLGLSIFCYDESITLNKSYDWCYNCMKCDRDCLYNTNDMFKYTEYKKMIRGNKFCRIMKYR